MRLYVIFKNMIIIENKQYQYIVDIDLQPSY